MGYVYLGVLVLVCAGVLGMFYRSGWLRCVGFISIRFEVVFCSGVSGSVWYLSGWKGIGEDLQDMMFGCVGVGF